MKKLIAALVAIATLSACVPLVFVGGAAVGLWVGSDPRKPEVIKTDFDMDAQLEAKISETFKERAHVNVNVFNDLVLLTGELPDAKARDQVEAFAWSLPRKPRKIYNETIVAVPSSAMNRLNDSQISARVKTAILAEAGDASAVHILVTTERQVVYLMGIAKADLIERAAIAASKVSGVVQVVKLAEVDLSGPADNR